jgi:large subunit ribosomal protein L16
MPLMPKRTKHRKVQKGSRSGSAKAGTNVDFGEYGLKSMSRGWLKATQIEACRVAINRKMKRKGKLWIRVFPDKPVTEKPIEVRMGKGKGNPEYWVAVVRPGTVMFEIAGISRELAESAVRLAGSKLPIRSQFVARRDME